MTEIYKIKNNHAPPIMHHLFQFRENTFSLTNFRELAPHNKKTSNYGLGTVSYRAPFLWDKLPSEYNNSRSFSEFTQININNNKKGLHHFIQNTDNLYVTFLVFTETAIKRCFFHNRFLNRFFSFFDFMILTR